MTKRTRGRSLRAFTATMAIAIAATVSSALSVQAQHGPRAVEPAGVLDTSCNPTIISCDARFASALSWRSGGDFIVHGRLPGRIGEGGLDVLQAESSRSHWLIGAIGGFVVGATATYFVLHSGGSTSKCDRDANQDAINRGECAGLVVLGGLVGAGAGAFIGSRFRSDAVRLGPVRGLEIGRMRTGQMTVAGKWVH